MPLSDRTLEAPSSSGQAPSVAGPHPARLSPGRSKRVRIQAFREVPINTLKLQKLTNGRASPLKLLPTDSLPIPKAPMPAGVRPSPRGPPPTSLLSSILGTSPMPIPRPQPAPQPPQPTQLSSNQPDESTTGVTPSADAPTAVATVTSTPSHSAAAAPSAATPAAEPSSAAAAAPAPPPLAFWALRRPSVNPRTVELLMTREVLCLPPDLVSHDLPSCSELAAMSKLDWSDVEALLAECSC